MKQFTEFLIVTHLFSINIGLKPKQN